MQNKFSDLLGRSIYSFFLILTGIVFFYLPIIAKISVISVIIILAICEWFRLSRKIDKKYFLKITFLLYILLSGVILLLCLKLENGSLGSFIFGIIIISTVCADIGAYFTGRLIGGFKPFPNISPGKTISGYIGGVVFGVSVPLLLIIALSSAMNTYVVLPYISFVPLIIMVVFGQAGDLFESYFKRIANVKDSGNILGPHGGILDRFDAIFGAALSIPFLMFIISVILYIG